MRPRFVSAAYHAARAQAALDSARRATSACARIAHDRRAALHTLLAANEDNDAPAPPTAIAMRSIPLWVPANL